MGEEPLAPASREATPRSILGAMAKAGAAIGWSSKKALQPAAFIPRDPSESETSEQLVTVAASELAQLRNDVSEHIYFCILTYLTQSLCIILGHGLRNYNLGSYR